MEPERIRIQNEREERILEKISTSRRLDFQWLEDSDKRAIKQIFERFYLQEGMSTTTIALRIGKSPSFVWGLCRRLGIELRTPNEGKALAAPGRIKTLRRPFSGSEPDMFYLKGFGEGDLDVRKPSSNAVMVSSTTTHPAFTSCFRELFRPYGPIYEYPTYDAVRGYRWKVASRLDNSFDFLLPEKRRNYPRIGVRPELFFSWLAGLIDADGSVTVIHSGEYVKLVLLVSNQDLKLLSHVKRQLAAGGYHPTGPYLQAKKGKATRAWNIRYTEDMWKLYVQRADEVRAILRRLPLRHGEKVMRKDLAQAIPPESRWLEVSDKVQAMRAQIKDQVKTCVFRAELEYKKRRLG